MSKEVSPEKEDYDSNREEEKNVQNIGRVLGKYLASDHFSATLKKAIEDRDEDKDTGKKYPNILTMLGKFFRVSWCMNKSKICCFLQK